LHNEPDTDHHVQSSSGIANPCCKAQLSERGQPQAAIAIALSWTRKRTATDHLEQLQTADTSTPDTCNPVAWNRQNNRALSCTSVFSSCWKAERKQVHHISMFGDITFTTVSLSHTNNNQYNSFVDIFHNQFETCHKLMATTVQ